MLRRTNFSRIAKIPAAMHTSVPCYEILNKAWGTSNFDSSKTNAAAIASLHRQHLHILRDWADASQSVKQAVRESAVTAEAAKFLDVALDKESSMNAGGLARPRVLIAYGSQTGTAAATARSCGLMAAAHGFNPIVVSMNEAATNPDLLSSTSASKFCSVLFICSTYGSGEFPTNAGKFMERLSAGCLPGLKGVPTAVFGLGNSSNNHNFNGAAKRLHAELKRVNSTDSLIRPIYSCELQGHDAAFRTFKSNVWAALAKNGLGGCGEGAIPDTYEVSVVLGVPPEKWKRFDWLDAHVTYNERVSAKSDDKHVFFHQIVEIPVTQQIQILGRRLKATDQLVVHPSNSDANVAAALKLFNLTGNEVIECAPLPGAQSAFFDGQKITTRTLFRDVIDLQAVPQRSQLSLLASAAQAPAERDAIEDLANDLTTGSVYNSLTQQGKVLTVLDILTKYPSIKLTLSQAVTRLPHIAPRYYSNAHDPHTSPEKFHVVYNCPRKFDEDGKLLLLEGLATSHMARIVPASHNQRLWCTLEPGKTTLPALASNALLVGLGSGIGLIKACLEERAAAVKAGKKVGTTTVIYGFRNAGTQLFKAELEGFKKSGVDVRLVPSEGPDGAFASPFDSIDSSLAKRIKEDSTCEILYVGLGGTVPGLLSSRFVRLGVNVGELRTQGRYHEEYFSADHDQENQLKNQLNSSASTGAGTLAERVGACEMFCMQCEQTQHGIGCSKVGVCGKTPVTAALQDLLIHQAKILGFWLHHARLAGAPENAKLNHFTLFAMFTTLTNVNFDDARFVIELKRMHAAINEAKAMYLTAAKARGSAAPPVALPNDCIDIPAIFNSDMRALVESGRTVGVLSRFSDPATENASSLCELLTYGLKGICAYADHALVNRMENPDIYTFVHKALSFLLTDRHDMAKALDMCMEAGKCNVTTMSLLKNSHDTGLGHQTPNTVRIKPVPGKCILVSGHDLIVLDKLLERCDKEGINVYTHGEMLPAHAYPKLAKHRKSLVGHFGTAWMRQSLEFVHFPGAVLMTTNCITEPHSSYKDTIFTAGAVGWEGVKHLGDTIDTMNFEPLIAAAKAAPGFTASQTSFSYPDPIGQPRPATYTVGFGTETVLSVADKILQGIQSGAITRIYVVGGCDGYEGSRQYFGSLVKEIQETKTGVVLTVGCGKYQMLHMDLGTIGDTGIPRILDCGQCNNSIDVVNIALALSEATKTPVADLPISIALSWLEQKAVAVLLSLISLGLKPIRIGPSLPAFVTKDVLSVLVNKFGVLPCGTATGDIKSMTSATGMIEKK